MSLWNLEELRHTQAPAASPECASFNHIPSADSGARWQVTGNLRGSSLPSSIFSRVLVSVLTEGDVKCKRFTRETAVREMGRELGRLRALDPCESEKEARKTGWRVLDCSTVLRMFGKEGSL